MMPHRIAAGAIAYCDGRALLVRYQKKDGGSFLVAPGGKIEAGESLSDAAVRETLEETGVSVVARKVLYIENLQCIHFRMCKIWFLCDFISGEVSRTDGARTEGIIEARWFSAAELCRETVFPSILTHHDWASFASPNWQVMQSELRKTDF
jgi:8-oxo-dGTP diphosphatase